MRVLCLIPKEGSVSFHDECTSVWESVADFIKWLSKKRSFGYDVRYVTFMDLPEDDEYMQVFLTIVKDFDSREWSYEDYHRAFNALWEISTED